MKFETHLDRRIFKTIKGCESTNPQRLVGIIAGVDAMERLLLAHDELSDGLNRLANAGYISEIEPLRFYDASSGADGPCVFSGITKSDYDSAVQEYSEDIRRAIKETEAEPSADDFIWLKLFMRWATPDDRGPTDDDEDAAEELAEVIDPIITQSGLGEINGFEYGLGKIDVLIFGKATDSDVDQIYELLAPHFRAFKCPTGSRIIRVYEERNEEIESDIVSDTTT